MIDLTHPLNVCRASAGTGKTYTLAAYYVGLLLSGEDYRSILAITFTNKATSEMSERILSYLYAISQGEAKDFLLRARSFMIRNAQASDTALQKRAHDCFRAMLLDYDNVRIQTIDSFLQTLMTGLAGVLHMSAGWTTELDSDHVIRQAVDQLLTTEMSAEDRTILEDYMQLKLDQEAFWDVRASLCAMAKELYSESVQTLDADNRIVFSSADIIARRRALEEKWKENTDLRALKILLEKCDPTEYNRNTMYAYQRLKRSVEDPAQLSAKDRFRGVSEKSCNAGEMAEASLLAEKVGRAYNTLQLTLRFSRDMELMASLKTLIRRNLNEANCALLAQTAGTLSKALKAGDADFILEKAGIRYHHILMDEFQDTSRLQWNVIRQLVQDVLAGTGNTLLIVGDIKQSIYRWRNGDWHIMASLGADGTRFSKQINHAFPNLTRNYRSSEQVVKFNLSVFRHIMDNYPYPKEQALIEAIYDEGFTPETLEDFYQSHSKKGGYVRFRAFPKGTKEELAMDMFDTMEDLLRRGAVPEDMMILVREKKEATLITDIKAQLDEKNYPELSKAGIVSADSFLLEASQAVKTVIAGLQVVVRNDEVAQKYLEMATLHPECIARIRENINPETPLYEAMCELISILLADDDNCYTGTEIAYVNNLLDRTKDYISAYGSNMEDFLIYWEDTLRLKPIPASSTDAIRILTVHASKGLQSQTLFVPFCMWPKEAGKHPQKIWCEVARELEAGNDFVPIQDGAEMENSAYHDEYEAEHLNMRVDNLNMLYVALTRAEDNLYVSTAYPVTSKGLMGTCNHVGRYLMDWLEADEYEAGEPVIKPQKNNTSATAGLCQSELWADSSQVRFVQSQEGALYTDYGDEAYRRLARIDEGLLCHEIFAHLRKAEDLDEVLDMFRSRGTIESEAQRLELRNLISSAWEGNDRMRDWFTAPWILKLEEAIYIDHRELRPDRVMINPDTNEAVVLDYKFGGWEDKYIQQVREYMTALKRMGYASVKGYLWFARQNKLMSVNG